MTTRDKARTRKGDPDTSREAAATVDLTSTRERVLALLTEAGPGGLTHDKLIERHRAKEWRNGWPEASPSSLRSRCAELVKDGEVEAVPEVSGKSNGGRRAHLWRAANVHNEKTADHEAGAA